MTAGGGRRGAAATRGGPRQRPQPREPPRGQTEPPGPLGLQRSGAVACAAIKRRVRPAVRGLTLSYRIFVKGWRYLPAARMDSEVQRAGRILDLIDDAWREDKLPYEDVAIPLNELPEPEQDNGGTTESVKEQEMKWTDLALQYLHENVPPTGN